MPKSDFKMTVVVTKAPLLGYEDYDKFRITACGEWIDNPAYEFTDCIGIAWSDNFTLLYENAWVKYDDGTTSYSVCKLNDVVPEAGVAYDVDLKIGCPSQDAEDITHDTFVKALLHIDQYRGETILSVWLCRIAKNAWLNQLKKQKRETPTLELNHDITIQDEYLFEWIDIIEQLAEPYRSILPARLLNDMEYSDIARAYRKTESWARVTYHRAKIKLRDLLNERRN